jgi:hypothetical protein
MIAEKILRGCFCKSCQRPLWRSYLSMVLSGVEKDESILYPVFCVCGSMTSSAERLSKGRSIASSKIFLNTKTKDARRGSWGLEPRGAPWRNNE